MTFSLKVLALAAVAFVVLPAVASAGDGDRESKAADRQAKLQAEVDSFVACMNGQDGVAEIAAVEVSALRSSRTVAHRGRGLGLRPGRPGFGRGAVSKAARIVVHEAGLDRRDEAVRTALRTCRQEQRGQAAAALQAQVDELAACLVGKGYAGVEAIDVSERPRLALRGRLGRVARIMAREAGLDRSDEAVRDALKDCRRSVRAAASA